MNNKNQNENKKYYKIFILTKDNYYFIVEKRKLYKSKFFSNIFQSDKTSGNIRNPLFLQTIDSKHLKYVIQYLENHFNNEDNWDFNLLKNITYYDINKYFHSDFDKAFFKKINEDNDKHLINKIKYFGVETLNNKLRLLELFRSKLN